MTSPDCIMRESLIRFVEREIIPRYDGIDKGHQRDYVLAVIEQGQYLAGFYDVDSEAIYAACACHDLGIRDGREQHHIVSGKIIREELDLSAAQFEYDFWDYGYYGDR